MSLAFEDERYVRLYVRDTPHWVLGPWEARAVMGPVLRKLDRSGVLDLGDDGLEALAAVVALPLDIVVKGMEWWTKKGTFEMVDGRLVMPRFLDAQEAAASDKQRARAHRERVRDRARTSITTRDDSDANRDEPSRKQTERHEASHAVTPSRAVPCRTEPSHTEERETQARGPEGPTASSPAPARDQRTKLPSEAPALTDALKAAVAMIGLCDIDLVWVKFIGTGTWKRQPDDIHGAWLKFAGQEAMYQRRDRERDRTRDEERGADGGKAPAREEWKPKKTSEPLATADQVAAAAAKVGVTTGAAS